MPYVSDYTPVFWLQEEVRRNTADAQAAAHEYRTGSVRRAAALLRQTESRFTEILKGITELSEAEADLLEPAFTELETELLDLRRWAAVRYIRRM